MLVGDVPPTAPAVPAADAVARTAAVTIAAGTDPVGPGPAEPDPVDLDQAGPGPAGPAGVPTFSAAPAVATGTAEATVPGTQVLAPDATGPGPEAGEGDAAPVDAPTGADTPTRSDLSTGADTATRVATAIGAGAPTGADTPPRVDTSVGAVTPPAAGADVANSPSVTGTPPAAGAEGQAEAGPTGAATLAEPALPTIPAAPTAGSSAPTAGSPTPSATPSGPVDTSLLLPAVRTDLPVQQVPPAVVAPADTLVPARHGTAPLPQQLGGPAFALARTAAAAPGGTSTITVTVAPEDLGPITIRASLSPDGARIEFFSATDGGREALRQALPELRREASSSGLSASLDLGTGTPDDSRDGPRDHHPGRDRVPENRPVPAPVSWTARPAPGTSTLDLFA